MGIRAAFIFLTLTGVVASSVVVERMAFFGYIWWACMRPDVLAYMDPTLPISLGLAGLTGLNALRKLHNLPAIFGNPMSLGVIALLIPTTLSYFFAVNMRYAEVRFRSYVQMLAVLLLMPLFIETVEHLKQLVTIIGASIGFLGLKFGVFGLAAGGVIYSGGYGGMMDDNNLLALAFAMAVPLCWYCAQMTPKPWFAWLLRAMAVASSAAVIFTNSRGGSLSLAVAFLMIASRAKYKFAVALGILILAGGTIYTISDVYTKRMSTLVNVEEEASAASRIHHARAAIAMWKDYPLFGVGFGGQNYALLSTRYRGASDLHVVHNSYLSMLVDSGIFAFLIYTTLLFGTIISLGRTIRKTQQLQPHLAPIPLALQTSLCVFALGSTFYSCQRFDVAYMLILCSGMWKVFYMRLPSAQWVRQPVAAAPRLRRAVQPAAVSSYAPSSPE